VSKKTLWKNMGYFPKAAVPQADRYAAMKAYIDIGFKGPLCPDQVPSMAGDSNARSGYGALGSLYAAVYVRCLIEAVSKNRLN
jgi:mannonate dehydratase